MLFFYLFISKKISKISSRKEAILAIYSIFITFNISSIDMQSPINVIQTNELSEWNKWKKLEILIYLFQQSNSHENFLMNSLYNLNIHNIQVISIRSKNEFIMNSSRKNFMYVKIYNLSPCLVQTE